MIYKTGSVERYLPVEKSSSWLPIAFGVLGAIVGGCCGYFLFFWFSQQGFYALILPPAMLGLAAGLCARQRSVPLALICAVAGLGLGLFTEWTFAPFVADKSFVYFVKNLHQLKPQTLIMLSIGTVVSFRLGLGTR